MDKNCSKENCKKCHNEYPKNKLVYSICNEGHICLDCYHNQYDSLPSHPKPIFLKGHREKEKNSSTEY